VLEFFFFMLILLGFAAGSGFIYVLVTRLSRRVQPGGEDLSLSLLRDEVDSLTQRLGRVEEELEFYKRLGAPDEPGALPPSPAPGDPDR
jgi:hypothetical protein